MLWLGTSQGSGAPNPGSVDVSQVDLESLTVVRRSSIGIDRVDDHTSPSVLVTADGLQVGWAPHQRVDWLAVGTLGRPLTRIVRPDSVVHPGRGMSYVSAHLVGNERWVLYRGEQFTWNLLTSRGGPSWHHRGVVTVSPMSGQRPYLLAASDGRRLHVIVADGNPTEFRGTSVSYAVISPELTVADARGRRIGRVGSDAPSTRDMTRLTRGRSGTTEAADADAWLCDLQIVDRQPVAALSVRDPWPTGSTPTGAWRHRFRWALQRPDGRWIVEHLAWAGSELYERQPDYTGLVSIDPTNAERVVISTDVHPLTGAPLVSSVDGRVHRELFEGRRLGAARWRWTPMTHDSTEDNLRPVIVADHGHRATAWMRGTYRAWNDFDTQLIVRNA